MRKNPAHIWLVILGAVGISAAIVLAIVSNNFADQAVGAFGSTDDLRIAAGTGAWANIFGLIGITASIGALVVAAVKTTPETPWLDAAEMDRYRSFLRQRSLPDTRTSREHFRKVDLFTQIDRSN